MSGYTPSYSQQHNRQQHSSQEQFLCCSPPATYHLMVCTPRLHTATPHHTPAIPYATMADSTQEQPTLGNTCAEQGAAEGPIYAVRLGCVLHILHIAVTAGLEDEYFLGPMGKGSWHEWEHSHLVALLGTVWYNISKSSAGDISFKQFKMMVERQFPGAVWKKKFVRPAETRWMVIWEAVKIIVERWEHLAWLHSEWAAGKLLGAKFTNYWLQSAMMLQDPVMHVHAKFAAQLGEKILNWAYCWLRGEGGYFVKCSERQGLEQLPPGMRFAELSDFSREFLNRLGSMRDNPEEYFGSLLEFARNELGQESRNFKLFMKNFRKDRGFFAVVISRWNKWMERHQHLPLSMARIGCSSFFVGKWAGAEEPVELAVGQEFARAFLHVVWPEEFAGEALTNLECLYRELLTEDLKDAKSSKEKDELTFGMFSVIDGDGGLRAEVKAYADSARGRLLRGKEGDHDPSVPRESSISAFDNLYREVCVRFFFVPIHQQLVESFFSYFDQRTRGTDFPEVDGVRTGQYRSGESRHITASGVTPEEIYDAGRKAQNDARVERNKKCAEEPLERFHRKRPFDPEATREYMSKMALRARPRLEVEVSDEESGSSARSVRSLEGESTEET